MPNQYTLDPLIWSEKAHSLLRVHLQ